MASNHNLLLLSLVAVLVVSVSGFQFEVGGGQRGWSLPAGNEPSPYDQWAENHRFHIGDTLYFKYQNDSVLVVNSSDYINCNTSNPIAKYEDGNTVFQFDRSGLFYFISGEPDHCKSGQKLIVRVIHPTAGPTLAPSPAGGWEMGPSTNSTTATVVVSYLTSLLAGVLVVLYVLM